MYEDKKRRAVLKDRIRIEKKGTIAGTLWLCPLFLFTVFLCSVWCYTVECLSALS